MRNLHQNHRLHKESKSFVNNILTRIPRDLQEFPQNSFINSPEDVLLTPKAYLGICLHATAHADPNKPKGSWVEVIGFLLGRTISKKNKIQIFVQDCYPVGYGSSSYVEINEYKSIQDIFIQDSVIVGWYHSHPNFGLFMSNEDYSTQKRYQIQWQHSVGLVIDPTLISSINYGIDIFRLNMEKLDYFEPVSFKITGNFTPKPLSTLKKIMQDI